ncbi:MAG TPA: type II secretion system F family protein, partial [Acidimicrobiia bacterium]|nr:type II secretion system F family protein [Acidimicrobiia bacterium]
MSTASSTFEYRARDRSGAIHAGEIDGSTSTAVAQALRERGFIPLKIDEKKTSAFSKEIRIPGLSRSKVKTKDISIFSRQMATMVNSGLTLIRVLSILEMQTDNDALRQVISDVRSRVERGTDLSTALEAHPKVFGHLYVSMVRAGEVGGALDETLSRLADTLEANVRLRGKVKSAMAYPVVVLFLILAIVAGMLLFVVPIFQGMYEDLGGALPAPTQLLITISGVLTTFWWVGLLGTFGGFYFLKKWKATPEGAKAWDSFKLKLPVFGGLVQKVAVSRFARTFSVLSRTGVPVLQALDIVAMTAGNALVADAVREVQSSVKGGESLAGPRERHDVFPPKV